MSAIKASPAVYIILAENPWKTRAMTRTHGARARQNMRVAENASAKPVSNGACLDELWSANQPAIAKRTLAIFVGYLKV